MQQLPLRLTWSEQPTFQNFVSSHNERLVMHVFEMAHGREGFCTYLYALDAGLGRTHLLQAACHAVTQLGRTAVYLSFKHAHYSPQILEGMASVSLLCLDDIEQIAGQAAWEEALFDLYHRMQDGGVCLLVSARGLPKEVRWGLPDLQSRFAAADIFQIQSLSDEEKILVLKQKAYARGLVLSKDVGQYLLSRFPRDMHGLTNTLDVLDSAALSAQRRLTVPFIKTVF
jgi:DnaA family protein